MTQQEKQLLLQDLCARLPYNVVMSSIALRETTYILRGADLDEAEFDNDWDDVPYLRPMSSMTEEEKVEYCDLQYKFLLSSQYPVTDGHALFDWLNKKMFDYRGLIPKGLALEAPEGMYNL